MQNGLTALSRIGFREKRGLKEQHIKSLLGTIYQKDGRRSRLSSSLFSNLSIKAGKDDTDKDRIAKHIYQKLKATNINQKLTCLYCGNDGAKQAPKYIFPFITMRDKYPNAYSMGNIDSLNFCTKCMLISFASNSRWLFRASTTKGNVEFISAIMFFSKDADTLGRFYANFIEKDSIPLHTL